MDKQSYDKLVNIEVSLSKHLLDQFGREQPDPTPVAPPIGYKRQASMADHVRAAVARHLHEYAQASGHESFEEANDFEIGDEYEPETAYEIAGYEGDMGPAIPAQDPHNPGHQVWINPKTGERLNPTQFAEFEAARRAADSQSRGPDPAPDPAPAQPAA